MKSEKRGGDGKDCIKNVRQVCVREGGTLLLKIKTEYPYPEKDKTFVTSLYEKIGANCERWAKEKLGEKIRAEYNASEDGQKKFRFGRSEYSFFARVQYENEKYVMTLLDVNIKKSGKSTPPFFTRRAYIFRKSDGRLVPPGTVLAKGETARAKKVLHGRVQGVFFRDGTFFAFCGRNSDYRETAVKIKNIQ